MASAATVTVGCKLPHGLHLDLPGKRVTLKGANSAVVQGGHGITLNVDKNFFESWMALNKTHPAVKAGLIFAHTKTNSAIAEAKEKKNEKTGFEGLDPNKPGPNIAPADEGKENLPSGSDDEEEIDLSAEG